MTGETHVVADVEDLPPGEHEVVEVDGNEVGVFNVGGEYRAYTNWCPHHGAPVCTGSVHGTTEASYDREELELELEWVKEDRVLLCPWHGWEFDLVSGETLHSHPSRLVDHDVHVEDGQVVLRL